jgi:hypothetical protein
MFHTDTHGEGKKLISRRIVEVVFHFEIIVQNSLIPSIQKQKKMSDCDSLRAAC